MLGVDQLSGSDFEHQVEPLLETHRLSAESLASVRRYGEIVLPQLEQYIERFYAWLETQPEYAEYFSETAQLTRVQGLAAGYWRHFFAAEVDGDYIASRRKLGQVHALIGLSLPIYIAAMDVALDIFLYQLYDGSLGAEAYAESARAVNSLAALDTGLVVESYSDKVSETIASQNREILESSTPVTLLWEGILMLPVVGVIDSKRAQDMMTAVLDQIAKDKAACFILDISGVAGVDTEVADHFIKITKAAQLMGCACTISGISPGIAQTIVGLGAELGDVKTMGTLQGALAHAFRQTGAGPLSAAQDGVI